MAFQPLTADQYQKAIDSGFSPETIVANEQKRKASSGAAAPTTTPSTGGYASTDYGYLQNAGIPGAIANVGIGAINTAKNIGVGVGSALGKAALGIPETLLRAGAGVGNFVGDKEGAANLNRTADVVRGLSDSVYKKPFAADLNTLSGKTGEVIGTAATFVAPTTAITKGQQVLGAGAKALNVGGKVVPWITQKLAQVVPEMVGTGATQYVTSGGDTKSAVQAGVTAGVLSTLTHVGADVFRSIIPQSVKDNVTGFLKWTGKTPLKGVATGEKTDDAVGAFTTMVRNNELKPIEVVDKSGAKGPWDPTNTSMFELPQVLYQTKKSIYDAYTKMATQAGDLKAMFGQDDFETIKKTLSTFNKEGYGKPHSAAAKTFTDMINRYGKVNPTTKAVEFNNVSPDRLQTLLEQVNAFADPNKNDVATAKVANQLATKLREMLDDKITSGTGAGYKQLRQAYSQLKSIEKDVIERTKTSMRGTQGLPADFIDGLATIDVLQGLVTANPAMIARGFAIGSVKALKQISRSPEGMMQRAFKELAKGPEATAPSGLMQRAFGSNNPMPKAPAPASVLPPGAAGLAPIGTMAAGGAAGAIAAPGLIGSTVTATNAPPTAQQVAPVEVIDVPDRGITFQRSEIAPVARAIFSEVSNRFKPVEVLAILNVGINKAKATGKTLAEVMSDPNFIQGATNNRYATSSEATGPDKKVLDFVNKTIEDAIANGLKDTTDGATHFVHITQGKNKDKLVTMTEDEFTQYLKRKGAARDEYAQSLLNL